MLIEAELIGADEVQELFDTIADNMLSDDDSAEVIFDALARGYKRQWEEWAGFMVRTGATRSAWTNPNAPGAVREVHGLGNYRYGSSIEYNKYWARTLSEPADRMLELIADGLGDYYVEVKTTFRRKHSTARRSRLAAEATKAWESQPPKPAGVTRGYFQTRGGKRVFVRSYTRRSK